MEPENVTYTVLQAVDQYQAVLNHHMGLGAKEHEMASLDHQTAVDQILFSLQARLLTFEGSIQASVAAYCNLQLLHYHQ